VPGGDKGSGGDLYIEVKIDIPKKLTDSQAQLLESLRKEGL
jgi:DnaJ-class molecular chaperone